MKATKNWRKPAYWATLVHPQQLSSTVSTCTHMAAVKQDHLFQSKSKSCSFFIVKSVDNSPPALHQDRQRTAKPQEYCPHLVLDPWMKKKVGFPNETFCWMGPNLAMRSSLIASTCLWFLCSATSSLLNVEFN